MGGAGIIDRFLDTFTRYIDSGFGRLGGEVGFLASTLVVIDVTLAALFWSMGPDEDIIARLVKKSLFVGAFASLIGNWNNLARIVFESFSGLGLKAAGAGLSADSLSQLLGYVAFFENAIQIANFLIAWLIVLLSIFILAIQLFVTLIEFKLTTLAGFVLIPFGLFGKTAFLAELVLGNVVSYGVKVLVLAVIVGIGSTLFAQFTQGFASQPTVDDAMALVLAALSLLSLGIFGPGMANGIVSGGPQLGAGAVVGTGLVVGGAAVAGYGALRLAGGTVSGFAGRSETQAAATLPRHHGGRSRPAAARRLPRPLAVLVAGREVRLRGHSLPPAPRRPLRLMAAPPPALASVQSLPPSLYG